MATVYRIISDYDGKEGWNETLIYDGIGRTYTVHRIAEEAVTELQRRATKLWPQEEIRYTIEGEGRGVRRENENSQR
jgi:hypothetical protein